MKEIKVYEIELAEYIERAIDGICFIVQDKGEYVAHMFDEFYEMNKEKIEKTIQESGYCNYDYRINRVEVNKLYKNVSN